MNSVVSEGVAGGSKLRLPLLLKIIFKLDLVDDVEFNLGEVVTFRESEEHDPVQGIVREINQSGIIFYKLEYLTLFNLQNRKTTEHSSCINVSAENIINSKYYLNKQ